MGQFCRRCNPKQRGPYPNIRANEHKWRPIGSNENTPWVVVTIPDELEKNGQPQNEKMKFESNKHETNLSMKLTAQVQARILSKAHREPANKLGKNKLKRRQRTTHEGTDDKETPKPATESMTQQHMYLYYSGLLSCAIQEVRFQATSRPSHAKKSS